MLSDDELRELTMEYLSAEGQEAVEAMMERMRPEDMWYFKGYLTGYAEAVSHIQMAERDGFGADVERNGR